MTSSEPSKNAVAVASSVAELTQCYLSVLGEASTFSQAWLRRHADERDAFSLCVARSVRDVDENCARTFLETHELRTGSWRRLLSLPGSLSPRPALLEVSPRRGVAVAFYNASFLAKASPSNGNSSSSYVEVQDPDRGVYRVDTSAAHGRVVGDAWFGGVSWSPDERFLVYVAQSKADERRKTAVEAMGTQGELDASKIALSLSEDDRASAFDYLEDWGEKYVGVSELGLFVLDLWTTRVTQVPGIDAKTLTVGQPVFASPAHDELRVAYTAWSNAPRRLGMIYCYQRSCAIYLSADLSALLLSETETERETQRERVAPSPAVLVSENLQLARSPRVSPHDHATLAFLGHETGFLSHNGCVALFTANLASLLQRGESWRKVVDVVENPLATHRDSPQHTSHAHNDDKSNEEREIPFPGIFCDQLPRQCFCSSADTLLLTSSWAGREALLVVSLSARNIVREVPWRAAMPGDASRFSSVQLLDVASHDEREGESQGKDRIVTSVSSPISPSVLISFTLCVPADTNEDGERDVSVCDVLSFTQNSTARFNITHKFAAPALHPHSVCVSPAANVQWKAFHHVGNDGIPFSSIVLFPTTTEGAPKTGLPIVLVPHGGPHSVTPTSFLASYFFLCTALQAVVVHVNYRGSVGFGQASVESLLSNVGENDVQDMIFALRHAQSLVVDPETKRVVVRSEGKQQFGDVKLTSTGKAAVVGGSHGGFLGAHLCGQFPDLFSACALRNPVTDISANVGVTDIPDWCFSEALQFSSSLSMDAFLNPDVPTLEQLQTMRRVSPVHHIANYKTPTLICLGAKDRRVPPSQGLSFYHALKRRNVITKLMVFPEDVHAIDHPASETEHWIAIAHWLKTYMSKE